MTQLLNENTKGVYIIAATPFTDTGEIDWGSVDSMVEFYIAHGVDGLTILGMMGEAQKLGDEETAELTRRVLRQVNGRVSVIVGVSNPGTYNLVKLSKIAMDNGAAGVMLAPTAGLKTDAQVFSYFGEVSAALGTAVPLVLQDYPPTTGVYISPDCVIRLVDSIPKLVMFKHEDCPGLRKLSQLRKAFDGNAHRRISILCGNGGLYLSQEMARGADGAMTGFAYPEMLVDVVRLFQAGKSEAAEDLFDIYLPLIRHEQQLGTGLAIRKEVLRRRGAIRSAAARAPGPKLDADDIRELDHLLARLEASLSRSRRQAAE